MGNLSEELSFNNLDELLPKVSIAKLQGGYEFTHCGFTKDDLEKLLRQEGVGGIVFLPSVIEVNNTQHITLLAIPVRNLENSPLKVISPAILSFCPPRCKFEVKAFGDISLEFPASLTLNTTTV